MYNDIELKKDLLKSKEEAKFQRYDGDQGRLMYTVKIFGVDHLFPIHVFEDVYEDKTDVTFLADSTVKTPNKVKVGVKMADDLKGASFSSSIKGASLIRWISRANANDDLMKLL
jgi:DNA-binding protein YbaB